MFNGVRVSYFVFLLCLLSFAVTLAAAEEKAKITSYGGELEGFDYPYPVNRFDFVSQQQSLQMAYLDIPATNANGRTVVLLHGKNFCAATWEEAIKRLTAEGYRVVAPDQIGFCKSSKTLSYQFSFQQLASNTKALLDKLELKKAVVLGHSMGGMLATRFALMYSEFTEQLVLVNPIGLEDWKALGVPYLSVDAVYENEKRKTAKGIRQYQKSTYYIDQWQPSYDRWVDMLAGMYNGEDGDLVAWNQALTADMVFTQPVVYEFAELQVPTLLLIGEKDNTAIGKGRAPKQVQRTLGRYDVLGEQAAKAIPNAELIEFPELGHSPHIQQPDKFYKALLKGLEAAN